MQIDRTLILKLEELAKLELSENERSALAIDLSNILSMVEKLHELDTTGIEPLVYVCEEAGLLREDAIKDQVSGEQALQNSPDNDGSKYFKVPKVL